MSGDAFERRRFVQQHFTGRISSEVFDPGFSNRRRLLDDGYEISVYLNDVFQEHVVTADPEDGFVQRRVALKTEVRRGAVAIRISKRQRSP